MYRCEDCKQVSKPGEDLQVVVSETRSRKYDNTMPINGTLAKTDETRFTEGWEIVSEVKVCRGCALKRLMGA